MADEAGMVERVRGDFQTSHVDPEVGTRAAVGFFGPSPSRLFGVIHTPPGPPRGGLVICPPLHAAFSKNYRSEVLLGRALSREGFAAIRFHYRGQGHSDGDGAQMSLATLREDALIAHEYLRALTGDIHVGFMGCRLGGFIAAAAAARHDGAPLVLWDPVADPAGYLREASRARRIGSMSGSAPQETFGLALMDQLQRDGFVDIHGYPMYLELVRSLEGRTLSAELGDRQRSILLIQIARTGTLRPEYVGMVDGWSGVGSRVAVSPVVGEVAWWLRGAAQDRERLDELTSELVSRTTEWMRDQFPAEEVDDEPRERNHSR